MTAGSERTSARVRSRIEALLATPPDEPDWRKGYLDLLGSRPPEPTGIAQRIWQDRLGSAGYDAVIGLTQLSQEYRTARKQVSPRAGQQVLDIGCGPGNVTPTFAKIVGERGLAVGVDVSEAMLARAVQHADVGNVGFVRADAADLPFADDSFDVVWSSMALHLLADPYAGLDEIARLTRPGGQLVVFTPCNGGGLIGGLAALVLPRAAGIRMFDPDSLPDALAERGFTDIRQRVGTVVQSIRARRVDPAIT